jgi:hypothetical protein
LSFADSSGLATETVGGHPRETLDFQRLDFVGKPGSDRTEIEFAVSGLVYVLRIPSLKVST